MGRLDTSDYLVHFTKGVNAQRDFASIASGAKLRGGTGYIKGNYRCVCFTEAPLHALQDILLRPTGHNFKYKAYGIIVKKAWLFQQGGRPVIYQAEPEYDSLPESHRWRHVRYEPAASPPVDFTWEREWRIKTDELNIDPESALLVVPGVDELREVCEEHTFSGNVPMDLVSGLKDDFVLDAEFNGRTWITILLSNPSCGWSGLDVDLD
jgi:hypothetical protein